MSQEQSKENLEVEETDEDRSLLVVDPDDYQKTKRLKTINETKQDVIKIRRDREDWISKLGDQFGSVRTGKKGVDFYAGKLGMAVAQYGSELLPLIEEGLEKGVLGEGDVTAQITEDKKKMDILRYIKYDGRIEIEGEIQYPPEPNALAVYRQLNRIQRKLGLGLELEEDKGPAEI